MKKIIIKILLLSFLFTIPIHLVYSQTKQKEKTLKGYLIDNEGLPVTDVTFSTDSIEVKARIKESGSYRIQLNTTAQVVMAFSHTRGMKQIIYTGQRRANFIFESDTSVKKNVERETNRVKRDVNKYNNIYEMILAKVPGAKRNGNSIIITRGTQTMTASEEPLFIVDGFETQSIAHILPQEVNSIAIKRGTDTTEYGIKGANGVILITLKK